ARPLGPEPVEYSPPNSRVDRAGSAPRIPMERLSSYVLGRWHPAAGELSTLVDPTPEAPLAQAGSGGIDFRAVLAYARERGGPGLRTMTFAERGKLLAAIAGAIHEKRD